MLSCGAKKFGLMDDAPYREELTSGFVLIGITNADAHASGSHDFGIDADPKHRPLGIHGILFYELDYRKTYYPTHQDEEAANPDGTSLRQRRSGGDDAHDFRESLFSAALSVSRSATEYLSRTPRSRRKASVFQ